MFEKSRKSLLTPVARVLSMLILASMLLSACSAPAVITSTPAAPAATDTSAPAAAPTNTTAPKPTDTVAAAAPTATTAAAAATATTAPTATTAAKTFKEAPMLADQVKAGKLPPLDQRLPKNPRVLPVYEKVGTYGGTWHRGYSGIGDRWGYEKLLQEHIVKWYAAMPGMKIDIMPNWVDTVTPNADSSAFTFHIREGLKWSDGQPLTTDDVKFWYEDVFQNTDLVPTPPDTLVAGGKPMTIEIKDQYTFDVKFTVPNPLFLEGIAQNSTDPGLLKPGFALPAHYLKQFLPKYASQADLDKVVADKKVKSWKDLWGSKGVIESEWLNPDMPVLTPWKVVTPAPAQQIVLERNPYYFAVDPEGNQLPYIDKVVMDAFQDQSTADLWGTQGKFDMEMRHAPSDPALIKANETKGNYHAIQWSTTQMVVLFPNLNVEDPVLNKLYNTSDFRQALNISLNRDEIQQIAFKGFGKPRSASPVAGTPYYDAEFETKWTKYDAAAANKLLDGLGLDKKDSAGFRQRSDGKRLSINTIYVDTCDFCELVQKYWKDVGIEFLPKAVDRSLFDEMMKNGKADMLVWWWDRNNLIEADPSNYIGTDGIWAPLWGQWFASNGKQGQEPPADHPIRKIWDAWKQATSSTNAADERKAIQQIVTIHKENMWVIGLVGETPAFGVVSNHMHNVPDGLIDDEVYREEGFGQPAQYFLDNAQ